MAIKPPTTAAAKGKAKPPVSKNRKAAAPPPPPTGTAPSGKGKTAVKKFNVEEWDTTNEGKRILIYGDTGIGKSSLAFLAPKPVFLGLDEGAGELRHPITGEKPKRIPGLETFTDVRQAMQQVEIFDPFETVIVDTVTILQGWAEPFVVRTIPTESNVMVQNIVGYGYNKGYKHLYNVMKGPLADADELIRRGKHVIWIAQTGLFNVPNPGGSDYLREGPRLHADKQWSIEALYCEWANYILRINYFNTVVKDKRVSGSTDRAVFVQPELHFRAKTRTPWN
ncbi:hypothetical protein LCGC14_1971480, partial [marine sediment metagenome]